MKNLETLIQELCPDGVEFVKLGDVCDILDSKRKPVAKGRRSWGMCVKYREVKFIPKSIWRNI